MLFCIVTFNLWLHYNKLLTYLLTYLFTYLLTYLLIYLLTYNHLHTIPACDGQTDGRTPCHGIVRAMHTRRAVKTCTFLILLNERPM